MLPSPIDPILSLPPTVSHNARILVVEFQDLRNMLGTVGLRPKVVTR